MLYSNCILTKGIGRSLIADLQKNKYLFVPNDLYKLFSGGFLYLDQISLKIDTKNLAIFHDYVSLLLENELIFEVDESEVSLFPALPIDWDYPSIISNLIVDIGPMFNNIDLIRDMIESLNCLNIQFRFFREVELSELLSINDRFIKSNVQCIEFFFPFNQCISIETLRALPDKYTRIRKIMVYNSGHSEVVRNYEQGLGSVVLFNQNIESKSCGIISPSYFSTNIETYTEGLNFNTCLNRKLSIDAEGNIKNCPSMAKSYGNISDPNLDIEAIVDSEEFQKVWHISKDKIHVCKDCEFRHVCTDCRAYVEDPSDILSKPLKCGYNPYTCEWEEWSTHPMKQKAIDYYGMRDIL